MKHKTPLVLLILDGFGYRAEADNNAIAMANTPTWDRWWKTMPHTLINASGNFVGLPDMQMGNSEVGHMHIGAGRVIPQDLTRINNSITNGSFAQNEVLLNAITELKKAKNAMHVIGLLSEGGVHSHEKHLYAFLHKCYQLEFDKVYLHLFLDGRDTPPKSAAQSIKRLENVLKKYPVAKICSISGRYYAMDRDNRFDRTQKVYELLTEKNSDYKFTNCQSALQNFYNEGITDEFIPPSVIDNGKIIADGDSVFFFNFRADRARQLTNAFLDKNFQGFRRNRLPKLHSFVSMTRYANDLATKVVFAPINLHNTLGEVIAKAGLSQLRIAETEKYAHVTFFFNGGQEKPFANEKRILIPSPKVSTYDLSPAMSAGEITEEIVKTIKNQSVDVIICNFANADMVGHTGNFNATCKAIEALDKAMHDIAIALKASKGHLLITADHGNAECMYDEQNKQPLTSHTNLPVPFVYVGDGFEFISKQGTLIDIAPTILELLNIPIPKDMEGTSLLTKI